MNFECLKREELIPEMNCILEKGKICSEKNVTASVQVDMERFFRFLMEEQNDLDLWNGLPADA